MNPTTDTFCSVIEVLLLVLPIQAQNLLVYLYYTYGAWYLLHWKTTLATFSGKFYVSCKPILNLAKIRYFSQIII